MYKVGKLWTNPETRATTYVFYCGHADFRLWTENELGAHTMGYAMAERIARAYGADIIRIN